MSDKKDKPNAQDIDPEATVTFQRSSLTAPPVDEDATVAIQRSSLTEAPAVDEDATVMMRPIKASPESATAPAPESPAVVDEDATVMMAPIRSEDEPKSSTPAAAASSEPEFDPDATNIAPIVPPPPPPAPAAPAVNLPWNAIAGGVVVLLVVLYFVFSGDKASPPPAPKAEVAASPAPATAPAAPAAEAAPAAAPAVAKSEAPASSAPAAPAAPAVPAVPAVPAPGKTDKPAASGSVKTLLTAQIKRGQVAVTEDGGVATITLRDPHQFEAGGVDPQARLRPILQGVAAALDKAQGAIVVTGHADTSPSTDSRYPTNKELSAARAESAAKIMAAKLRDPGRVKSEGASDTQPLVPNDSAANRARNRRIVIVLKPAA